MQVTDTLILNVPFRIFDEPLYVAIYPDYNGKYLAIGVMFHGFKRSCIVNPAIRERLGTYDTVIEFVERWLSSEFGYDHCSITTID